jgi:hypothetical protein
MLNILRVSGAQVTRSNSAASFSNLAEVIRREHAAVVEAANDILGHVLAAGRALIIAQKSVPKGQWADWVKRSCEVSYRIARRYIQLTHAYEASGHGVAKDLAGLSLRALMRAFTPSKNLDTSHERRRSSPASTSQDKLNSLAWAKASPTERARFISAIGWRSLVEVMPGEWLPSMQQCLQARLAKEVAVTIDQNGSVLPGDLSVPAFLRISEVAP